MPIDLNISLAGAGVGFVVGLTGMGGGALLTPILVLLFGIDPLTAVSSDLVAAVIMKPVGGAVHWKRGTVNMRLVRWLMLGSVPAAFVSVVILTHITPPDRISNVTKLMIGVALLMAASALIVRSLVVRRGPGGGLAPADVHPGRTLAVGLFGGAMVGLTSVGSGSLMMVLLMIMYPALSTAELVGTDLVQAVPLVTSAAVAHMIFGDVKLGLTGSLLVGSIPAVYLGARISSRAPDWLLRPILTLTLAISGLKMVAVPTRWVGVAAGGGALVTALVTLRRGLQRRAARADQARSLAAQVASPEPVVASADPDGRA